MQEFIGLKAKIYSCLKGSNDQHEKAKDTKKCVIKGKLKFQNYKNCKQNVPFRKKQN